jgi:hypothetical protein
MAKEIIPKPDPIKLTNVLGSQAQVKFTLARNSKPSRATKTNFIEEDSLLLDFFPNTRKTQQTFEN